MGETIMELLMHLTVIGVVFFVMVSLRNKWLYSNEYGLLKKSDGLLLMLIFYLFLFFADIDIRHISVNLYYDMPYSTRIYNLNWLPFLWIKDQIGFLEFFDYIGLEYAYTSETYRTTGLIMHFLRFFFHLLPLSFLVYVLSPKKWIGLVVAEVIGIFVMMLNFKYLLGDGIVVIALTYLIICFIGHVMERYLIKDKLSHNKEKIKLAFNYFLATAFIAIGLIFVIDIAMNDRTGDEKFEGTIILDEHFDLYDGLITLNLTHANLYSGGWYHDNIKFNGSLDVDKSLYQYFGDQIYNEVNLTYKYAFYENDMHSGRDVFDFALIDQEKNKGINYKYQEYLELMNNYKYSYIDHKFVSVEDDTTKDFFAFKGISAIDLSLTEKNVGSVFEQLTSSYGEDDYKYFEYTYKINKLDGVEIDCYSTPYGFDDKGEFISFYAIEDQIIEETPEYTIVKSKSYVYNPHNEDIDFSKIEVKVYRANIKLEIESEDILLEFEKENFKE